MNETIVANIRGAATVRSLKFFNTKGSFIIQGIISKVGEKYIK